MTGGQSTVPTTTIGTAPTGTDSAARVSSVIHAQEDSGLYKPLQATGRGHLEVAIHDPVTAFGQVLTAEETPRVQIDFIEGLLSTDHEQLTDGSSGSITTSASRLTCSTGTTIGGYAVCRSRRVARYRAGQGMVARWTAAFPSAPTALSLVVAGLLNPEDALLVGYNGATFGFMRRIAGACAIHRLTVSVGTGGAETLTVTLNGVAFTVSAGGVLSTTETAEAIAERVGGYTGWTSSVSPTSNGSTVTFIQGTPAVTSGAFTLTSTGTATGTFATVRAGAANDSETGFIAQTAWNIDRMDGSNGEYNPSGLLLDPSKFNVYELSVPYLGAGSIRLAIMGPNGEFYDVHTIEYPNSAQVPSLRNPSFRMAWIAASLGSTTNLQVYGGSGYVGTQGRLVSARDPFAVTSVAYSASTTEYVAFAIRVRGEFAGQLCQREVRPHVLDVGVETSNRTAQVTVYLNPTITGTVNWSYVDQSASCVEYATPTTITPSGGRKVGGVNVTTQNEISFDELDLRLEQGDVMVVAIRTVSSTASTSISFSWQEV